MNEQSHTWNTLDKSGHTTFRWDPNVPSDVEDAREYFESKKADGFRAFRGGEDGPRVDRFDPSHRELTFVPPRQGG